MLITPEDIVRFNTKFVSTTDDTCWIWTGQLSERGYGVFWLDGKSRRAHRVAWEIHRGPIPDELLVRHLVCDNPPCVNHDHLAVGTNLDNSTDMVLHGRSLRTTQNPRTKLTEEMVMEARERHRRGAAMLPMAREYGVTDRTLADAVYGKTWKSLEGAVL